MHLDYLLDTDVVIDGLRGLAENTAYFQTIVGQSVGVSVVTITELYAGIRDAERTEIQRFLRSLEVVPVNSMIAEHAGGYQRKFGKSHRLELGDALIAATAGACGARLLTLNVKHYPMYPGLEPPYRKN